MKRQTEQRRAKLRRLIKKDRLSAILVTNETNVTYLTGFTGDSSYLLLTPENQIILSDHRYGTQLQEECPGIDVELRGPGMTIAELTRKIVKKTKLGAVAIEAASVSVGQFDALTNLLDKVELVKTNGLVERLRQIKDKEEVAAIRVAIDLAEKAFAVVRASLRSELTEREVAHELERQIRLFGGDCCSFTPIVGVGDRAALPHYRPGHRRIGESDFVLIDWGARAQLYVSDLTRVLVTGRISPKLERIYGVVLKAQQAAIARIRPGARMEDIDAVARNVIAKAGHGKHFGHSLGHGIGLQVHEAPRLAEKQEEQLKAGMVVTVEPGIYLPNWGGVRIEDDVLVTKSGHEVLSSVPKELADCIV